MALNLNLSSEKISEPSSGFDPLPPGKYAATVFQVDDKEFGPKSNNAGRPAWNIQFRISDGQTGANRRVFQLVGLFPSWAPTDKNPDGSDNFLFYQFFAALLGKSEKEFRAEVKEVAEGKGKKTLSLPDAVQALGTEVVLDLGIETDTWNYDKARAEWENSGQVGDEPDPEDFKRNNIKRIIAVSEAESKSGKGKDKSDVIRL